VPGGSAVPYVGRPLDEGEELIVLIFWKKRPPTGLHLRLYAQGEEKKWRVSRILMFHRDSRQGRGKEKIKHSSGNEKKGWFMMGRCGLIQRGKGEKRRFICWGGRTEDK